MIKIDDVTVFNPETGEFGYLPNIIQFEVDKNFLTDGSPAIVSWNVFNATKILLNDEIVGPKGEKKFYLNDFFEVILVAENKVGQTTPRKILIDIDRSPPVIHFFQINQQFGIKGYPATLSWHVQGAFTITIDNDVGNVTGLSKKKIILGDHGHFKLIAKNYFGFASTFETSITIFPTPLIENLCIPTPKLDTEDINNILTIFFSSTNLNSWENVTKLKFINLEFIGTKLLSTININQPHFYDRSVFYYLHTIQKGFTNILKSAWKPDVRLILKTILLQK